MAGADIATSSGAIVSTAAPLTALFDRQLRKRVALRCAVLEAERMPLLHVGHGSVLATATFHHSSDSATAKAWEVERGPSSLPAALWAALQWLLDARESHAAAQWQVPVASSKAASSAAAAPPTACLTDGAA
ncbi:hypothetical protein MTO96_013686 [Rhipicephalus appendiculatus]